MNNFDFSDYEDTPEPITSNAKSFKSTSINSSKPDPIFDFSDYEIPEEKTSNKPFLETLYETTKEFPEKLGKFHGNVAKGAISGATLGLSENVDALKPEEGVSKTIGEFAGMAAPIGLTAKALSYPFKALQGLSNFGKVGKTALDIGHQAATGAGYSLEKQAAKNEGFSGEAVAEEAAIFGVLGGLFKLGAEGYSKASNWIKSLGEAQQKELITKGRLPDNLTPEKYKIFQNEVVPELQLEAKQSYEKMLKTAIEDNEKAFQQEMLDAKVQHERNLYEKSQKQELNEQDFAQAQKEYQEQIQKIAAENEEKIMEIQQANQQAIQDFQEQTRQFQEMQQRQELVERATETRPEDDNLPYREAASDTRNPSLPNRVGNIISKNEPVNSTNAGRANIEAVRANDAVDYQKVREAYDLSEKLNSQVVIQQPNLVQDMREVIRELSSVPKLSPPQEQLLTVAEKILQATAEFSSSGNIIGFKQISNRVLQEQAKALRYFMDFNFEHGNARGIFSPVVKNIENAIEMGAEFVGHKAAVEANVNARRMYAQWADAYDNPYIRPYRDTRNLDYSKTFKISLNTDEFNVLNNILDRSNAGQQLAQSTRRALVEDKLAKFIKNPHAADGVEFNRALRELRSVISTEEEQAIRQQFQQARREPQIKEPSEPKLKEVPKLKEIPEFKSKKKEVEPVTHVKVPVKGKVQETKEMIAASKQMHITTEEALKKTKTPTGLKELKEKLSKPLYNKIVNTTFQDLVFEGNIQHTFTGKRFHTVFNKSENFALLEEMFGEKEAMDMLVTSKAIGDAKFSKENIKKYGGHIAIIKLLSTFGIL